MLLLALDTSTTTVAAAVHDGSRVLAERSEVSGRRHAEVTSLVVQAALDAAGVGRGSLTGIVAGVGPGPFTGLRVGVVTARALGLVLDVPVWGVCSLDALAVQAAEAGAWPTFVVATDARRREVYWAAYRREPSAPGGVTRTAGPNVTAPQQVPPDSGPVIGPGASEYREVFGPSPAGAPEHLSAGALATLAAAAGADGAAGSAVLLPPVPLYLRRPDVSEPTPRKRVLR